VVFIYIFSNRREMGSTRIIRKLIFSRYCEKVEFREITSERRMDRKFAPIKKINIRKEK